MTIPSVYRPLGLCALFLLAVLPAAAQVSQAEKIPVVEKVGDRPQVSWTDGADSGITYQANATGQAIKVWFNIPAPGTYRIKVRHRRYGDRGQVQHFINNVAQGSPRSFYKSGAADFELYDLGTKTFNEPGIKTLELRVHAAGAGGGRFISVDYIETTLEDADPDDWEYVDDFEAEAAGQNPSHWIESNVANEWKVDSTTGSKTYMHPATANSPTTWLHVFERDVEFTTRVMFKSKLAGSAQLQLLARYNQDDACIMAGYDFDTTTAPRRWHLMEKQGKDDPSWHLLTPENLDEPMEMNRWYTLKVVARGNHVALYVDDMQHHKLFAKDASAHLSPGRVGFRANGVEAYFDDVKLQLVNNQGKVQDGVLEYTILPNQDTPTREGATLVAMNGKIELLHRRERFTSTDNGQTFTGPTGYGNIPDDRHAHTAVLRLNSGKLLKMQGEYNHPTNPGILFKARRSADEGLTWDTTGGVTWTDYRDGPIDPVKGVPQALIVQMNDKLSQIPSGRVFYTVTVRRYNDTVHEGHKCEVYYSDDEGTTWSKAAGDTMVWDAEAPQWIRFAEGKVIATSTPNELRLISTWVSNNDGPNGTAAGSMRRFISTDNGLTWGEDDKLTWIDGGTTRSLPCARSSFGVDRDLSASGLVYYMVWVYNDDADHPKLMFPRNRLALVKSTDGVNWTYLMDVERWISPDEGEGNPIVQIIDPGIIATPTHLFITFGRSDKDDPGENQDDETHNLQKLRVVRVDKSKLTPRAWPTEY